MRSRDARPEYARSSDFRFGNTTLIPLPLARTFHNHPILLLSLFPPFSPFSCLLLLLSSDGNTNASGRGQVQIITRALTCKPCGYTRIHSHRETITHACTHTYIHTHIRARAQIRIHRYADRYERNFVSDLPQATALLAHLGAPSL